MPMANGGSVRGWQWLESRVHVSSGPKKKRGFSGLCLSFSSLFTTTQGIQRIQRNSKEISPEHVTGDPSIFCRGSDSPVISTTSPFFSQ
ncbi:hypothetical protein BofuT4_uP043820.1 [Botrytis cinerea T4]|uniref:Uncharacterized protein n=1 Tax=Botryotinia fuckeliana (strain T4) TaxID=999810 RepID=G2Y041_BOTF4|nr:hypothetical protein BofuT4_uP043820.1 [Botrytis cinerea T4]